MKNEKKWANAQIPKKCVECWVRKNDISISLNPCTAHHSWSVENKNIYSITGLYALCAAYTQLLQFNKLKPDYVQAFMWISKNELRSWQNMTCSACYINQFMVFILEHVLFYTHRLIAKKQYKKIFFNFIFLCVLNYRLLLKRNAEWVFNNSIDFYFTSRLFSFVFRSCSSFMFVAFFSSFRWWRTNDETW